MDQVVVWGWFVLPLVLHWPGVFPEVSHRLTLIVCCAILGLRQCWRKSARPLPRLWGGVVVVLGGVMAWRQLGTLSQGSYFDVFYETAALSDGLLLLLLGTFGLWAWCQQLRAVFRWVPVIGLVLCTTNLLFAVAQQLGWPWHLGVFHPAGSGMLKPSGVVGLDRTLGAYGVVWLPVVMAWRVWAGLVPLALVGLAGKFSAWVGAGVVAWAWCPVRYRWHLVWGSLVGLTWWVWQDGNGVTKVVQRLETWGPFWSAFLAHPFLGHGWSVLAFPKAQAAYDLRLPFLHSDWLSLLFHGGIVATGLVAWAWWRLVRASAHTTSAQALRISILALGVMGMIQSVVGLPIVAGVCVAFLAWWWVEQRQGVVT